MRDRIRKLMAKHWFELGHMHRNEFYGCDIDDGFGQAWEAVEDDRDPYEAWLANKEVSK